MLTSKSDFLKNAYKTFPKGTIHIIGVESELTPENRHIAMLFEGHYFIGSDNGIFSMIKDDLKAEKIVEINIHEKESSSFSVLDVFVKVAAHISRMGKLEVIGKSVKSIKQITNINPVVNNKSNQILGSVIYIDNYGNVVTNINRKFFPTADLIFSAICMGKRILFSYEPPHESSRLLVCSTKNWLIKYPSDPIISMPS